MEKVNKRELRLNPLSLRIYGEFSFVNEMDLALFESITMEGIKEPLIITHTKLVISGNRRLQVALKSNIIQDVPVIYSSLTDEQIDDYQLFTHNIQRVKNEIQIAREYETIGRYYGIRQGVKSNKDKIKKAHEERKELLSNSSISTVKRVLDSKKMIVQLNNCTEDEAWDLLTDLRVNKRKEVNTIYESVKSTYNSIKNEQKALKEEIYKDDYFQIIHADSIDLKKHLADEMIDTIPTSPPYYNGIRTYQEDRNEKAHPKSIQLGHESTPEEYIENLMKTLRECIRVLKTTGSIFVNVQDHTRDGVLMNIPFKIIQAMEKEGLFNVQNIIWYKINPIFQNRKTFIPSNEYILHFVKNVKTYKWRNDWFGKEDEFLGEITHGQPDGLVRQFRSVLIYPSNDIKDGIGVSQGLIQTRVLNNHYLVKILKEKGYELQHNALFPLEVPMICILSTTDRGDSILDVFSGLATTGLIAYAHGCKYYGVDKSRVYSVKAGHRIQHFLDNHPHLVKRNTN